MLVYIYFLPVCWMKGAFLARCEEEATSRRDGVSMEDMMPPSYSDEEEYGHGSEGSDSDPDHDGIITQKGKRGKKKKRWFGARACPFGFSANARFFAARFSFLGGGKVGGDGGGVAFEPGQAQVSVSPCR